MGLFSRTTTSLEIDVQDAYQLQTEGATLVDIREGWEWAQGRAAGARHMPLGQIAVGMKRIPADKPVLLICASGNRSKMAAKFLQERGFEAKSVRGGTSAWARASLPLEF